ncbi:hypothetical protein D3C74_445470 [compost metagenome]
MVQSAINLSIEPCGFCVKTSFSALFRCEITNFAAGGRRSISNRITPLRWAASRSASLRKTVKSTVVPLSISPG